MDQTNRPLTPKQKRFCDEYMIDMNGKQAAIRAGYSVHTAEQQGSRLLSNAKVFTEIQRLMDERAERVEVDADYVVEKLRTIVEDSICPASSQVQALGLLARHLGMFTDKLDISGTQEVILIRLEEPTGDSSLLARHDVTPGLNGPESLPNESEIASSHALSDSTGHHERLKS